MCGSFTLTSNSEKISKLVKNMNIREEIPSRIKISPTDKIAIVRNLDIKQLDFAKWGLTPRWAKEESFGNKLFNARAETIDEKPSFRDSFKTRRCLIFADAFYEWKAVEGSKRKVKYMIQLKNGEPFTFAGLWDVWNNSLLSTTIITTQPNQLVSEIHNRMPVIIPENLREIWLENNKIDTAEYKSYLSSYPDEEMEAVVAE